MAKKKYKKPQNKKAEILEDSAFLEKTGVEEANDSGEQPVAENAARPSFRIIETKNPRNFGVLNPTGRASLLDNGRGLIILIMLVFGAFISASSAGSGFLGGHSVGPGFKIGDVATPFFMLTIGLSVGISYRKREAKSGARAARGHILGRGVAYVGVGLIFNEIIYIFAVLKEPASTGTFLGWDIIQSVGAGLIAASFFIHMKRSKKAIAAVAMIFMPYLFILLIPNAYEYVTWRLLASGYPSWGGLFSGFCFGGIILVFSILTEIAFSDFKKFLIPFIAFIGLAVLCLVVTDKVNKTDYSDTNMTPVDILKNPLIVWLSTVSPGYAVVSIALGAVGIFIAYGMNMVRQTDYPLLAALGRNASLIYILFSLTSRFIWSIIEGALTENSEGVKKMPIAVTIVVMLAVVSVWCGLAVFLDKKKWYFKI